MSGRRRALEALRPLRRGACAAAGARRWPPAAPTRRRRTAGPTTRTSKRRPRPRPRRSARPLVAPPRPRAGAPGVGKASVFSHCLSSSRSLQVSPRAHCSVASSAWWKGISVFRPSISYSPSARSMRAVACSRSASQTISLATIGSYIGETSPPRATPESTRTPGPVGSR